MEYFCSDCTFLNLNSGDIYGKFFCDTRLENHMANETACYRFCKAYSRNPSESKKAYNFSVEHSNSGCYLTTMLCKILNYPDNNKYLESMRGFRKDILQKDEKYRAILLEYDIIGPQIAENLKDDPINRTIATLYMYKYIIPITNSINKNNEDAINLYIEMNNSLKNIYNINNTLINIDQFNNDDIKDLGHGIYKQKKITLQ